MEIAPDHPEALRLKPSISFHLYTSSAPCGNACVRKWAKSKKEKFLPEYSPDTYPDIPHPKFFVTAKQDGQIAVMVKRYSDIGTEDSQDREGVDEINGCPLSCAPANSGRGCLMSCSDKVAKWNSLGLQGSLLIRFLDTPVYLSTVTIGRKFSRAHCERALCCRLSEFQHRRFRIHHPTLMCTSVIFDDSIIDTSDSNGADFQFSGCLSWSLYHPPEVIDGSSGLSRTNSEISPPSQISGFLFHSRVVQLEKAYSPLSSNDILEEYQAAKNLLLCDRRFFADWVKYKMYGF